MRGKIDKHRIKTRALFKTNLGDGGYRVGGGRILVQLTGLDTAYALNLRCNASEERFSCHAVKWKGEVSTTGCVTDYRMQRLPVGYHALG